MATLLQGVDDPFLVVWRKPGEDDRIVYRCCQIVIGHFFYARSQEDARLGYANLVADVHRDLVAVAGQILDVDAIGVEFSRRASAVAARVGPGRRETPARCEVMSRRSPGRRGLRHRDRAGRGEGQDTESLSVGSATGCRASACRASSRRERPFMPSRRATLVLSATTFSDGALCR